MADVITAFTGLVAAFAALQVVLLLRSLRGPIAIWLEASARRIGDPEEFSLLLRSDPTEDRRLPRKLRLPR
jgi:hypothetical protein